MEAYEILSQQSKRQDYDRRKMDILKTAKQNQRGKDLSPESDFFETHKSSFEYDKAITFLWKTRNLDKLTISPFGVVLPSGVKTYKLRDCINSNLIFELVAQNSFKAKQTKKTLTLKNNTYAQLQRHFKKEFDGEEQQVYGRKEEPIHNDES